MLFKNFECITEKNSRCHFQRLSVFINIIFSENYNKHQTWKSVREYICHKFKLQVQRNKPNTPVSINNVRIDTQRPEVKKTESTKSEIHETSVRVEIILLPDKRQLTRVSLCRQVVPRNMGIQSGRPCNNPTQCHQRNSDTKHCSGGDSHVRVLGKQSLTDSLVCLHPISCSQLVECLRLSAQRAADTEDSKRS